MPDFTIPPELIEHLNRGDCVLFVGDALDDNGSQSARLASALVDACGALCPFCESQGKCQRPTACVVPLTRAAQLYEGPRNRHSLIEFVLRSLPAGNALGDEGYERQSGHLPSLRSPSAGNAPS